MFGLVCGELVRIGYGNPLGEMVNYIQPKRVFPVHTENQELFKSCCGNIQTIKTGLEYHLK